MSPLSGSMVISLCDFVMTSSYSKSIGISDWSSRVYYRLYQRKTLNLNECAANFAYCQIDELRNYSWLLAHYRISMYWDNKV